MVVASHGSPVVEKHLQSGGGSGVSCLSPIRHAGTTIDHRWGTSANRSIFRPSTTPFESYRVSLSHCYFVSRKLSIESSSLDISSSATFDTTTTQEEEEEEEEERRTKKEERKKERKRKEKTDRRRDRSLSLPTRRMFDLVRLRFHGDGTHSGTEYERDVEGSVVRVVSMREGARARGGTRSWPGSRRLAAARKLASSNQSAWLGASSLLSLQNPPMWGCRCPWISSACHREKCCCALTSVTLASLTSIATCPLVHNEFLLLRALCVGRLVLRPFVVRPGVYPFPAATD